MSGEDKKERVIHTRVSETLEQELKDRANELGVSVSNLVRNVLQNAFGLVADIVADSTAVARSATVGAGRRPDAAAAPPSPKPPSDMPDSPAKVPAAPAGAVIGWQRIVLNLNAICVKCNDILPRGSDAALGITDGGGRPILCLRCLEESRHDPGNDS
jgi:hypothetical protein